MNEELKKLWVSAYRDLMEAQAVVNKLTRFVAEEYKLKENDIITSDGRIVRYEEELEKHLEQLENYGN